MCRRSLTIMVMGISFLSAGLALARRTMPITLGTGAACAGRFLAEHADDLVRTDPASCVVIEVGAELAAQLKEFRDGIVSHHATVLSSAAIGRNAVTAATLC